MDTRLLDEALAANGADFEDAVQLCCARRCDADYLITRDHGGFRAARVPIVTADELLTVLALDGPPADRPRIGWQTAWTEEADVLPHLRIHSKRARAA